MPHQELERCPSCAVRKVLAAKRSNLELHKLFGMWNGYYFTVEEFINTVFSYAFENK